MLVELEFDYGNKSSTLENFSQNDLDELRMWTQNLDKSKCIPKDLSYKQLILFYNACYQNINRTKICIEKYFAIRKSAPEFFTNRLLTSQEMKISVESLEFFFLPGRSVEGYDIVYHRLHDADPSKYFFECGVKLLLMTVDACLYKHGPSPGYVILFDMRGVRLGHILRLNLGSMKKFFDYVQEAMPVRMKAIHVLNTEPIIDKILALIKPFMDRALYDLIKLHNKYEDLESFYREVIPREALPPDYGGTLPDTQTLHTKCMHQLQAMSDYFKAEEEQRKTAIPDKHKEKSINKTFKNLDID